jgi:hypothetical protein
MRYGGSALVSFDELSVNKITIVVKRSDKYNTSDTTIRIGDIQVLGRVAGATETEITYGNFYGVDEEKSALLDLIGTENVPAELADITYVKGRKDTFYYDGTIMTRHYAELDVMIQEKDLLYTIATVTRSDCFLYPRPCQFSKLMDVPFRMKMEELLSAEARMAQEPDYQDIHVVTASNGKKGFYSWSRAAKIK